MAEAYQIALQLEQKGFWKKALPHKCHTRLQYHLSSKESWDRFYFIRTQDSHSTSKISIPDGEYDLSTIRALRRQNLGEDGLLSLRVRLLLIDATYYNSEILQTSNVTPPSKISLSKTLKQQN
jgi:hypothetical protein